MKLTFYIATIITFLLGSVGAIAQCDSLWLGNDTIICEGNSLQLDAGSGYSSYLWNDGTTGQFLTVTGPGSYWCEVEQIDSTNLVLNGDFSSGNTSFYTEYVWGIGGPWGILSEEGTYVIDVNAAYTHVNFSPCTDHTSGDGLYMIVNGDTVQGENVWCQSVPVEPNTDYYFSGWFTSVHPSNPAVLSYYINSTVIETVYLSASTCLWQNFIKEWNSGGNESAEICIINQNTELGGNDFGIDDIHLLKVCRLSDTVEVIFEPAPVVALGNDTVLCGDQELELSAGSGYASYLWSNGSMDSTLLVSFPGYYWVNVATGSGCEGGDTILIEYADGLEISLGNDTTLCPGSSLVLDAGDGFNSYLWSSGSTMQLQEVSLPGTYWVTVENEDGCTGSDTIIVNLSPGVMADLGGDTTICAGENYVLNPGAGYSSYLWQNGSTLAVFPVTSPGTYWVHVVDALGCSGGDTVIIGLNPSPTVTLGNDTTICSGTSLVLDPGNQYTSYLWQDNSVFSQYTVTTSGDYSVAVTNIFGCQGEGEIFVEVSSPGISLGPDTSICAGDMILLDPGPGFAAYVWQDNSTEQTYAVYGAGTYSVTVTDTYTCTAQESILVEERPLPVADLGGDRDICSGEPLILETAAGDYSIIWDGEPGGNTLEVYSGGTYTVTVSNTCGSAADTVVVTEKEVPMIDLGDDLLMQPGESVQLDAGAGIEQYAWQDGSTGQYFLVQADDIGSGATIWAEVMNGSCKNSDTITVEVFRVKVPNVITPNGDGVNDTFTPLGGNWGGISKHHIEVLNRWGEKVWESDDFTAGWDGRRNGSDVSEGTYFWVLEVFPAQVTRPLRYRGTVTILR